MNLATDSTAHGDDDDYVVLGQLSASTYRARAVSNDREVLLKLAPAAGVELAVLVDRLERLSHPNLPSFYEAFACGDWLFVVHERVEGVSLATMRQQGRLLSERESVTWFGQLLDVLQFLHAQSLVHGHVAPEHVLLRDDRETFLVGFELAPKTAPEDDVLGLARTFEAALSSAHDPRLLALVEAMLAADPEQRISTARAAAERFEPLRVQR